MRERSFYMRNVLLQEAMKLNKGHKKRAWWRRTVRAMAIVVVFCTTYALILPAITMEQETVCGLEAHTHTEACYTENRGFEYECGLDGQVKVVHTHDPFCYDDLGNLICLLPEIKSHTHEENCFTTEDVLACTVHIHDDSCSRMETVLVCTEEEYPAHIHDDECSATENVLVCTLAEQEPHTHGDACYEEQTVPCELPECEAHTHNETCSTADNVLVCTAEECEAHTHDTECYEEQTVPCELPETEDHTHDESCVTTENVLTCAKEETEGHAHTDACYEEQTVPCELPETEGHTHDESCVTTENVLTCAKEETEGHAHTDACYEEQTVPCTLPEGEGHTHSEECYEEQETVCELTTDDDHVHDETCYEQNKTLICDIEEVVLHTHDETCYDESDVLVCELEEVIAHQHTEACRVETGQVETILICESPEHTHEDACFPVEEDADEIAEYLCGMGIHAHVEDCYDAEGELVCSIPEHAHEAACLVEGLDLTADVETEEDWMQSVSGMTLTGYWPDDVAAVAQTQLNYKESVKNVVLIDGILKGYTRYGAWYGEPYADWNALFAAFCLDYAAVEDFPVKADAANWVEALKAQQLYKTADVYTPKPGDLVFIDVDQIPDPPEPIPEMADLVAIVAELTEATDTEPAKIKVIVGDQGDQVGETTYEMTDVVVIGFAEMPAGDHNVRIYQGEDFAVTVTYGREAAIPYGAELVVREILPGTEEYEGYYNQAVDALMSSAKAAGEEQPEISFARFFDITFVDNGTEVEPAAPVDIQISYNDSIPVKEAEDGQVIHFAKDGVEVLPADTYSAEETEDSVLDDLVEIFTGETEKVDTFRFTQDSFSVSGTLIASRAVATTATKVKPWEIDNTGNTMYVLYAAIGNKYYALDGNGYPVEITVNGYNITLPANNTQNLFWTFVDKPNDNTDYLYNPITNVGTHRYIHPFNNGNNNQNVTTSNPYDAALVLNNNSNEDLITFKIRGANNNYIRYNAAYSIATPTTNTNDATNFYVARVGSGSGASYNVWFDGTLGGMMSYYGAANENRPVDAGSNGEAVVELPETWQSSTKYAYTLRGWYDINNHIYYAVNPNDNVPVTATITGNTVFYADWIAATYDVGQNNANAVESLDTNNFITTYVFDYNALFNVMSQSHTGSITAAGHNESWTIYNNGETVPYHNGKSLGFAFIDYDAGGDVSYANGRDNINTNQGSAITPGIINTVNGRSGQNLLDLLFNPNTSAIGKYYAGTGNYLFQYMDSTTANYDGEHDGYYYLDARLNAASYNQSQQRFYLYNYLERTSDSNKDGGAGQYSDLLPFNSPYIFDADQVDSYTDSVRRPGYEYDAKDGESSYQEYNSTDDATTNYFFGIRSDIEFFLPNDTNTQDEYGNYGNISTRGEHMVFDFHGDDDVWVFVDGQLLLDIGGLHGIMHGQIDFSTGTIAYGADGSENVSSFHLSEGTHTMTVYYMERGSSQSNCAIYFNIAPRYDLEITKEDIVTADYLDGAVFSIYNDEAMTDPAELWNSFEDHEAGLPATNTFTVENGIAKCWGISAGKTYYIYETTPPPGYPKSDDMIRITLNNRGTATIETTTLHGPNGVATEGFAVIKQDINETLKIVALTVTNQKEGDHTEVRVEKTWAEGSDNLPQSITVYLTADGVPVGRRAMLNEGNGWSYTWTGLDKYRAEGIDEEIVYEVQEVLVPGFITTQGATTKVVDYVDWIRVDQMSDSKTFLLVHNGQALTYENNRFGWMDPDEAKLDSSLSAQWRVTTDHDGFHLKNGLGYTLTYRASGFYGADNDAVSLNQMFYYLNSRLVVHDHDVYYQFGSNGSVVTEDGLAFTLYQKEVMTGFLTNIINVPVDKEEQTYVQVNKVWSDGNEKHADGAVVIRLYANGADTGRSITLNAQNNWSGGFYELPYYQEDGSTVVSYTVVEDTVKGYLPEYSSATVLPALPYQVWVDANSIAGDGIYRFTSGSYALAVDEEGNVVSALNDPNNENQQWRAVSANNAVILQNVGTNRYLRASGSNLTMESNSFMATGVAMNNNLVVLGQGYLEITASHAGVTSNAANITNQKVIMYTTTYGQPGTGYTVTNHHGTYFLPQTGGMGTSHFTFGGLLIIAAALMYMRKFGRKQRKGGKFSR